MPRVRFPKGRKLLVLLAVAAAIGGAWWWSQPHPPPEPVYQGQRLSEWVFSDKVLGQRLDNPRAIEEHLRHFGPAAVGWLTYQVEHGRHPFDQREPLPFDKAPEWVRRWVPARWGGLVQPVDGDERARAALALELLGSDAAPAIPTLVRVMKTERTGPFLLAVALDLHAIGPDAWPEVHELLQQGGATARFALLRTMSKRVREKEPEPDAEVERIYGDIVKACGDANINVRAAGAVALGAYYRHQPGASRFESAIPELTRLLSDRDGGVRYSAAGALGSFGNKAAAAVPRLIEMLDGPWQISRVAAIGALGQVDQQEKISAPRLRLLLQDPNWECQAAAAKALTALGFPTEVKSADKEAEPKGNRQRVRVIGSEPER